MRDLVELLARGAFVGVIYGLIAIPICLVYLTTDAVDLAIGGYAVLAGATASVVGGVLGVVAGLGVGALGAAVAGTIYVLLSRRTSFQPITVVLATFGFAIALESIVLWGWGVDPLVERLFSGAVSLGGIRLNPQGFVNLGVAVLALVCLYVVVYRTAVGRFMRASAISAVAARLAGVPVRLVQFLTFVVGGLLAGVAGVLIVYTTGLDYTAGLRLTLVSLGGAVLFGLRSPLRGFLGGVVIGMVEVVGTSLIPGGLGSALPMVFILVVLGSGLLGNNLIEETRP